MSNSSVFRPILLFYQKVDKNYWCQYSKVRTDVKRLLDN